MSKSGTHHGCRLLHSTIYLFPNKTHDGFHGHLSKKEVCINLENNNIVLFSLKNSSNLIKPF